MSNLFKESLKFLTLKVEQDKYSPLAYELPKETELTEEQVGLGVLSNEKFEKEII